MVHFLKKLFYFYNKSFMRYSVIWKNLNTKIRICIEDMRQYNLIFNLFIFSNLNSGNIF